MVIREYFLKTSFHGLHFVAEKELHWTERLFWLLCVLACWAGSVYLMWTTLEFYGQNPTKLTVDSNYLDWSTRLPAIFICDFSSQKFNDEVTRLFTDKSTFLKKKTNLDQLVFFTGRMSENLIYYYPGNMSYYKSLRSSCKEIFHLCKKGEEEFDCCESFLPVETVLGVCFAMNSIYSKMSNRIATAAIGEGHIQLILEFINPAVIVYAISSEEVPTYKTAPVVKSLENFAYKVTVSLEELVNEPEVRDLDIQQRKCRFADENNLDVAKLYSYESCRLQCQKRIHFSLYNCTHHYMPYAKPQEICDDKQLIQLSKEFKRWTDDKLFKCDCDLACYGYEATVIGYSKSKLADQRIKSDSQSQVELNYILSHSKMIRSRARNGLDIIVSLGGTAGLFIGASLLSIIELIYYFTIRAINTKIMEHKNKKHKKRPTIYPFLN